MKSLCCIGECFAMCDVLCRHGSNCGRKVAKDFREQFVIDVHMDRLPRIDIPTPLTHQRNAGRIEVGVEACGSLERTNVELVGVFEGNLCLSGIGFVIWQLISQERALNKCCGGSCGTRNVQRPRCSSTEATFRIKKPGLLQPGLAFR